jgi:hypothetical protein
MKQITLTALFLSLSGGLFAADWITDWNQGLQKAKETGKPMFVVFTAEW